MLKFSDNKPSLIQIATPKTIYIVDFLASDAAWERKVFDFFVIDVCAEDNLLKIGQGLDNDLKFLKKKFGVSEKLVDLP